MIENFQPIGPGFTCATRSPEDGKVQIEPVVGWTLAEGAPVPVVARARGGVTVAGEGWLIVQAMAPRVPPSP